MIVYHVNSVLHKPKLTLVPRVPQNRMTGENKTAKRICVAPSVAHCLNGIYGIAEGQEALPVFRIPRNKRLPGDVGWNKMFSVYWTDGEPIKPRKVPDSKRTGELWLVEPTEFRREAYIEVERYDNRIYWKHSQKNWPRDV